MGRGGYRPGAGRKPLTASQRADRKLPATARPRATPQQLQMSFDGIERIIQMSQAHARGKIRSPEFNPFRLPEFPPQAIPPEGSRLRMAMDEAPGLDWASTQWAGGYLSEVASEGLTFLGYNYLSELMQRPEYRTPIETIATEMTRKWIKFSSSGTTDPEEDPESEGIEATGEVDQEGKEPPPQPGKKPPTDKQDNATTERIKELTDFLDDLRIRDRFKKMAEGDGAFGRIHLFLDSGATDDELKTPISESYTHKFLRGKVGRKFLKRLQVIEPIWTYPTTYNATNPTALDWYDPQVWYVMGKQIHKSRIPMMASRSVPDLLKPSYAFGGLALSQMMKPYVDIWLTTRQSVGDLIHAFSVMVLKTDLATLTMPGNSAGLIARAAMFNALRDNQGLMIVNNATEDFANVSAPLSGLHELQAQSQEHMLCLPAGTMIQTGRGKVPIEAVSLDDVVLTRAGLRPIKWVGVTDYQDTLVEIKVGDAILRATSEHPIWSSSTNEFVAASDVSLSHSLLVLRSPENMASRLLGAEDGGGERKRDIIATKRLAAFSIEAFGNRIMARSRMVMKSIIEMVMAPIINGRILRSLLAPSTLGDTIAASSGRLNIADAAQSAGSHSSAPSLVRNIVREHVESGPASSTADGNHIGPIQSIAKSAEIHSPPNVNDLLGSALRNACDMRVESVSVVRVPRQPVYNIEVIGPHEFFANDVLVHNSISRIPAVKAFGIQPQGLNASSEGEMRCFNDTISAAQNSMFKPVLDYVIDLAMITLWGKKDPDITYEFESLVEMTEKEKSEHRKMLAETDQIFIDTGVIDPAEARKRVIADVDSDYNGLDPDDVPEPPADPDAGDDDEPGFDPGKEPPGGADSVLPFAGAQDRLFDNPDLDTAYWIASTMRSAPASVNVTINHGGRNFSVGPGQPDDDDAGEEPGGEDAEFNEADHPRAPDGKFGSGGGSSKPEKAPGGSTKSATTKSVATDLYRKYANPKATVADVMAKLPPEVATAMAALDAKIKSLPRTDAPVAKGGFIQPDGSYTPEREAIHDEIIAHILSPEAIARAKPAEGQKPTITMLGGRGGSGKSWLTNTEKGGPIDASNALLLDADEIKGMLPGFDPNLAALYHEESSHVLKRLGEAVRERGLNVIYDATMQKETSVLPRLEAHTEAGYDVHAFYMFVPPEVAAERAAQRFWKDGKANGRYVPPDIVLDNTTNEDVFDRVKERATKWGLYSNMGASPEKIAESGNGK